MQQQTQNVYTPKKQLLCCRLCTDIFKRPITLSCGHTMCYYCLYKYMKQHKDLKKIKNTQKSQIKQNQMQKEIDNSQISSNEIQKTQEETNDQIPIPLCPLCCSMIWKPIKSFKENLTISNLISKYKFKPELNFDNAIYDSDVQNFNSQIYIPIQQPIVQPLPHCYTQIKFTTCFLDDILQQSRSTYVVIQWPNFKKNIGLAGKILRTQMQHHSSHTGNESVYRAIFHGMHFVKLLNKKQLDINLKSRYYTESTFYSAKQQIQTLNICKCQPYQAKNILSIQSFQPFLQYYDSLNNPHFLNQIYKLIDQKPFYERNNPQAMIYGCIRLLRMKDNQKKQIVRCFDDRIRIQKINEYLSKMSHLPVEQFIHVSVPGKYNTSFIFGVILVLVLLHYLQN